MAIVKKYAAWVVSIHNPVEGIYVVTLESPGKPFKYAPGQFLHLALDEYDGTGQWPESRCFSMQSAPGQEFIILTYAAKGRFTKRMEQELKPGSQVTLKLPYGDLFTKPHSSENTVFIAGGTGITPFLSLFTHELFSGYTSPRIYLGFKSKEFNIYISELSLIKNCTPRIYYQDTDGIIDIDTIFHENGTSCDYFISGPPAMINTFRQTLIAGGVPANRVLTDDWE